MKLDAQTRRVYIAKPGGKAVRLRPVEIDLPAILQRMIRPVRGGEPR